MDLIRPEIRIEFENNSCFEAESVVRGQVTIICSRTLPLKDIKVNCKGIGEVNWITFGEQRYNKKEIYLDETKLIINDYSGSGIYMSPGSTEFPFEFQLPSRIPSSYECWSCSVKYSCKAIITLFSFNTVSSPLKYHLEKSFKVLGHHDISNIHQLTEPASFLGEKVFTSWFGCCYRGIISTSVSINKKAYWLGDNIMIAVNIVNKTNFSINVFEARLMRMTTFKDAEGVKRSDNVPQTVSCIQNQCAQRPRSIGWARTSLRIPDKIPPTNLGGGCTLFKVSYYLKLLISCSPEESAASSLRIYIPIKIGYNGRTDVMTDYSLSTFTLDSLDYPPPYEEIMRDGAVTSLPSYDEAAPPPYDDSGFTY